MYSFQKTQPAFCWYVWEQGRPLLPSQPLYSKPPHAPVPIAMLLLPRTGERVAPTQGTFVAGGPALAFVSILGGAAARGGGRYVWALSRERVVDMSKHCKYKLVALCFPCFMFFCCAPRSVLSGLGNGWVYVCMILAMADLTASSRCSVA